MSLFKSKDPSQRLLMLRIGSLLAAFLYVASGFLLKQVFRIDDMIPLIHRLLFAASFSGLAALSAISPWVKQRIGLLLYALSSLSIFHFVLMGIRIEFETGSLVALLLVIPIMNFLFYRWKTLLYVNALLLVAIMGSFAASMPSLLQILLLIASSATMSGVSLWFTRRLVLSEERAKESEELFQDLFHHSMEAVAIHRLILNGEREPEDYVFLEVNHAFKSYTGLQGEDILGKRVTEVLPGSETKKMIAIYGQVVLTDRPIHFEHFFEQFQRYYRITAYPMGQKRFATVFEDITDLKETEAELKHIRQWYQHIVEHQKEIIVRFLPDTTLTFANPAFKKRFGLNDEDIHQTRLLDLLSQVEQKRMKKHLRRFTAEKPSRPYYLKYSVGGKVYMCQWNTWPLFDKLGMIQEFQSVGYDITDPKKTQDELQNSEIKYRALIEQSAEMLYLHDLRGNILEVNLAAIEQTQYSKEELLKMSAFDLRPNPSDLRSIQQEWFNWRSEDSAVTFEQEQQRKDGSKFIAEITRSKVSYGKEERILDLVRDITESRESEEKLREQEQLLRKLVQEVPGAVYQYQLHSGGRSYFPFASNGLWDVYGVNPDDVQKDASIVFSQIHHEDHDRVVASIQESFDKLSIWIDEYRVVHPEKGLIWVRGIARPEKLSDGSVLWHGYLTDASEMKRVTQELQSQKILLEGIIDGLNDVLAIQYPDHTIERYNRAGYQMLNMTPEEVKGKKCYELLGQTKECEVCATRKALASRELETVEKYLPEMDVYLECISNPILDEDGAVARVVEQLRDVTERKRHELRILEERDYMFRIFNSMNQYIIVNSIDRQIEFMNRKAFEDFGDLVGQACYQQLGSERPCAQCPIDELIKNTSNSIVNYTVEVSGRILEGTATVLTNLDGSLSIVEVLEDVTEQRKTENALQESEENFRQIAETIGDVFWLRSADNREMIYINPAYETVWGRTCESAYENPNSFMDSVYDSDTSALLKEMGKYLKTGEFNLEYRIVQPSGEVRWIHAHSFPVRGKNNTIIRHTGLAVDITRRKEMEAEIIESEEKFRNYIDSAPYGIFVADEKGAYLEVNKEACDLTGYLEKELLSMNLIQLIPPKYRESAAEHFQRVNKDGTAYTEIPYLRKDNTERLWAIHATKLSSSRFLGFVQDITERKQAQEQLVKYTTELELRGLELDTLYRMLNPERSNAHNVHQRLLQSSIPVVEGISITAACNSATYIGGDFYQVIRKGNKLVVYLSDVTGHGLDGTMFSLFVKNTIESYVELTPEVDLTTEATLDSLDAQLRRGDYPSEYAIAIFLMIIDTQTKEATYSGAGFQNAPVLITKDGDIESLLSKGLPITQNAPREVMDFNEQRIYIPEDAFLFLSTDGIYEQLQGSIMYEQRLSALLKQSIGLPQNVIVDLVQLDFKDFLGSKDQDDDVTIVVLSTGTTTEHIVSSSYDSIEQARKLVMSYYSSYPDCEDISIAAHEMIANAIEHGNQFDKRKSVRIQLSPKSIVIEDEGEGFEWQSKVKEELSLSSNSLRGRGIAMAQMLMGNVIYNQKGNRVSLIIRGDTCVEK